MSGLYSHTSIPGKFILTGFSDYYGKSNLDGLVRLNLDGTPDDGSVDDSNTGDTSFNTNFIGTPSTLHTNLLEIGGVPKLYVAYISNPGDSLNGIAHDAVAPLDSGRIFRLDVDGFLDPTYDTGNTGGLTFSGANSLSGINPAGQIMLPSGTSFNINRQGGGLQDRRLSLSQSNSGDLSERLGLTRSTVNGAVYSSVYNPVTDRWYVVGRFTTFGGQTVNGLARLHNLPDLGTVDAYPVYNASSATTQWFDHSFTPGTRFDSVEITTATLKLEMSNDGTGDMYVISNNNFTTYNGSSLSTAVGSQRFFRINDDGTLDTTFQNNLVAEPKSLYSYTDGRLLVVGSNLTASGEDILMLNNDGSIDTSYNFPDVAGDLGTVHNILPLDDGRFVISGRFTNVQNSTALTYDARPAIAIIKLGDITPPTVTFTTASFATQTTPQTVTFTVVDPNPNGTGVTSLSVSSNVDGALTPTCLPVLPLAAGTTSTCTVDISGEGSHTITVTATDDSANVSNTTNTSQSKTYIIDSTDPVIPTITVDPVGSGDLASPNLYVCPTDNVAASVVTYTVQTGAGPVQGPFTLTPCTNTPVTVDPFQINTIVITVTDAAGNSSTSTTSFYPVVTIESPVAISNTATSITFDDTWGNGTNTVRVLGPTGISSATATLTPASTGIAAPVALTCNPTLPFELPTPANATVGAASVWITYCTIPDIPSVVDTYTLTILAEQGGVSGPITTAQFIVEDTLPVVTITAPTTRSTVTITDTTVVITDANGISGVDFSTSTATHTFSDTSCVDNGTSLAVTFPTTAASVTCTGTITGDGDLIAVVTDRAGNTASDTESYIIDADAPNIAFTTPATPVGATATRNVVLTVTDPLGGVGITNLSQIVITDSLSTLVAGVDYTCTPLPVASGATTTCTVTLSGEGAHELSVTAQDDLGNTSNLGPSTFAIDNTAPSLVSFTSTQTGYFNEPDTILVVVNFNDTLASGPSPSMTVTLDTGDTVVLSTLGTAGQCASGIANRCLVATYTVSAGDNSSALTIATITASSGIQDTLGNTTGAITVIPVGQNLDDNAAIVVDTISPVVTITPVLKESNAPITTTTVTITDAEGVSSIDFGSSTATQSFICAPTLPATSVTCTGTIDDVGDLIVSASDQAGNSGSDTETDYLVDDVAPIIVVTTATGLSNQSPRTITFEITDDADNPSGITSVPTVTDNGLVHAGAITCAGLPAVGTATVVCSTDVTGDGPHLIDIVATDRLGNTVSVLALDFEIDTTAPTLVLTPATGPANTAITITCEVGAAMTYSGTAITDPATLPVTCLTGTINATIMQVGTFTVTATDDAGNGATQNGTYSNPSSGGGGGSRATPKSKQPVIKPVVPTLPTTPTAPTQPVVKENPACPYFTQYMRKGDRDGRPSIQKQKPGVSRTLFQVKQLQNYLVEQGYDPGKVDGVFGLQTERALNIWQTDTRKKTTLVGETSNFEQILKPWNLVMPTGRFYQSSERWANITLGCKDEVTLDNGKSL
jgi:hypothetical protein